MLCCGDREKGDVAMEEKWDYVVGLQTRMMDGELDTLILLLLELG